MLLRYSNVSGQCWGEGLPLGNWGSPSFSNTMQDPAGKLTCIAQKVASATWVACATATAYVLIRSPFKFNRPTSEAFAWSCTGPCEKLLKRSWWNPLGVLTWSCTRPCEKIVWRFTVEILKRSLHLRSCRFSALVLVSKYFWDAHRKFLYEALVTSPIDLHRRSCWRSCENV